MDVEGRRSSLEVETLWTTPLASARLVRHGPCWHGDPSSETFDAPTVIFTRSGAWNIRRDENVRADPSIIVSATSASTIGAAIASACHPT